MNCVLHDQIKSSMGYILKCIEIQKRNEHAQYCKVSMTCLPSNLLCKPQLCKQYYCCSLSCRPSACSNYIFILDLTQCFNGLGKDNCKTRRETFKFWDYRFDSTLNSLPFYYMIVWYWQDWRYIEFQVAHVEMSTFCMETKQKYKVQIEYQTELPFLRILYG